MEWIDKVRIETPEQIDVSLEIAGLGSRFVAWVVDLLYKTLFLVLLVLLAAIVSALLGSDPADFGRMMVLAILLAIGTSFMLGYNIYFEVQRNGQTPGKKTAGIRVIREGGSPVDFSAAAVRNILALADFLPLFYLLGGLLVLLNARGQRLGDMAAGTIVIRERRQDAPENPEEMIEKFASEEFVFTGEQLGKCEAGDRHILKTFFQRYGTLKERPRRELALKLADEFLRKTSYEPASPLVEGVRAVGFLATLYRDLETMARQEGGA
jgi:uncharacterized RDD family membrane protein YckC